MLLERYSYKVGAGFLQYNFFSEGPRGKIEKVVLYSYLVTLDRIPYYNLGFGDYDFKRDLANDLAISDNGDRDKILATVAFTAIEFTSHIHNSRIMIEGSTPSRTRLYQMSISKYYGEISQIFEIQGQTFNRQWMPFKKGENYLAFLASRK